MLNPKLSRTSWLTCLLLTFSLFAAPLAGTSAQGVKHSSQGRAERESPLEFKTLSQYGVDLTELARQGRLDAPGGYESKVQRTLRTLARNAKNNPVLVGEAGAARTGGAASFFSFKITRRRLASQSTTPTMSTVSTSRPAVENPPLIVSMASLKRKPTAIHALI